MCKMILEKGIDEKRLCVKGKLSIYVEDGLHFLENYDGLPIDFLFLDAWDVVRGQDYAEKHLEAYERAKPDLSEKCILSIDDTDIAQGVPSDAEFEAIANRELDRGVTYAAEYCGPSNLIGTVYAEDQVVLLAAMYKNEDRELPSLEPVCAALQTAGLNVRLPNTYPLASIADCRAALNELLIPTEEGFVLRNNLTGHRLKLKSPRYLERKGIWTFSRKVKLVHVNEQDEFLATFEDARGMVEQILAARAALLDNMKVAFDQAGGAKASKKQFAKKVATLPYRRALWTLGVRM
ncbi:hypothetical protein BDK51DRAFT_36473 [Blyttiomyces helicus]|uniref:Uncharacterized protein n=1 Tax=Blyttiomyces helicus TaxID=388810 RepID=A0A4P9W8A9_9FUNG|nr:hypothetical protein BDK51DRAFT_51175 [Blyttiomyces helicus]RKO87030.1 hypothetical protein BDK51DRAFT_41820 [Blyttiomyces helicus]RKO89974.1 hypothetical protein BDK51DRAFT_36473 [Blyttiomyces helicus]|eukprot:RKO86600.1 hypothetical protein BDK51DRAFT_51175 [Blyttiomyces helicus]